MHISALRGPLFQGSFPFGNRTLQTRPEGAFSFKISEGRESHGREKVKCKQTNKGVK